MAVKSHLGLLAVVTCLFVLTSNGPEPVSAGFDIGAFLYTVQYKLTGNFEFNWPWPDGLWTQWDDVDVWFSKESCEDDWEVVQYKYMGGYGGTPVLRMFVREVVDVVKDAESIIRDVIEAFIFQIGRLGWCLILCVIQRDITHLERPHANLRSRFEVHFSKRERVEDRLFDSTRHEWQAWRCVKRGLETVLQVGAYIIKFFYYGGKMIARFFFIISKTIIALVHVFIPWLYISMDGLYCYQLGNLFSERLGLGLMHTCRDLLRTIAEAWFDFVDTPNEEFFVEGVDIARLFIDIDDLIPTLELDWFSNMTYWRAADAIDRVRFDGTCRMDRYYTDFASKIQSNEDIEEHVTDWQRDTLLRVKEEWCTATFMPPVNEPHRVEFKIKYLSYMVKNDHRLDLSEARCLLVYLSRNLAYNSDPVMNTDAQIGRSVERMFDLVGALPRLQIEDLKLVHQNYFLQGVHHFLRESMHTMARQVPATFTPQLAKVVYRLKAALDKMITGCPGTTEWRHRVNSEMEIVGKLVGAVGTRVSKLDCKDTLLELRMGGPFGTERNVTFGNNDDLDD